MKFVAAIAFFCLFTASASAMAQPASPPSWAIDKVNSKIEFEGTQMGAPFKGQFKDFSGTIQFDPANLQASKADITIAMDTADANSDDRNKNLKQADWFDVAKYPSAHFITTSIEKGLDAGQYVAKGNLTIKDVTAPVTLPFTLSITSGDSGSVAKMAGQTQINRLDFHVGQGQWTDTKTVENPVTVRVSLTAKAIAPTSAPSPH